MPEKYIDINAVHIEFPPAENKYISAREKAYQSGWNDACRKIREYAPAADVEPVIHAVPLKIKPTDTKALFERKCPECGSLLFATDKFCGNCGSHLESSTAVPEQSGCASRIDVLQKLKEVLIACDPHITGLITSHTGGTVVIMYDSGETCKVKISGMRMMGAVHEILQVALYGERGRKMSLKHE